MRLLFAALILTLLSQPAWSEAKSLDRNDMKGNYTVRTICVDGYKFVVGNRLRGVGGLSDLTIVQFYEEKDDVAVPAKC